MSEEKYEVRIRPEKEAVVAEIEDDALYKKLLNIVLWTLSLYLIVSTFYM